VTKLDAECAIGRVPDIELELELERVASHRRGKRVALCGGDAPPTEANSMAPEGARLRCR